MRQAGIGPRFTNRLCNGVALVPPCVLFCEAFREGGITLIDSLAGSFIDTIFSTPAAGIETGKKLS